MSKSFQDRYKQISEHDEVVSGLETLKAGDRIPVRGIDGAHHRSNALCHFHDASHGHSKQKTHNCSLPTPP